MVLRRITHLFLFFAVSSSSLATAFVGSVHPERIRKPLTHRTIQGDQRPGLARHIAIRGGGTKMGSVSKGVEMLTSALQSGHWGIPGLWGVASAVVLPLTMYRQGYSFSVGYGFSVFAMACALYKVFGPSSLLLLSLIHISEPTRPY